VSAFERAVAPLGHPVDADVRVPGSKSLTNRALVCAALAAGPSTLEGALRADDTEAMVGCLAGLGVSVESDWAAGRVTVDGAGGRFPAGDATLDARMSGTTARFVAPLLALGQGRRRLTGHPQLLARPMGPIVAALRSLGAQITATGEDGRLPVAVDATGGLRGGRVELPGHVSSQFLSGLLLAAPAMDVGLTVVMTSPLVSRPYVALTMSTMAAFDVDVGAGDDPPTFTAGPGRYRACDHRIEPDATAASYFFAAAAICGGRVRVPGLGSTSRQGDLAFADLLGRMGAEVAQTADWTEVRGTDRLEGIEVDLADLSDTAPTLAVVAACASSPTTVTGVGFIRAKESDRIGAPVTELRRCGVDAEEQPDGFVVRPDPSSLHGARIETYDDHRMAMSFAVLGLRVPGMSIADPECVAKTFPDFFEVLDGLR
jgi:3-phosphoshikimate 1-carboxyvinyltransferase